jgi:hypothetical protein
MSAGPSHLIRPTPINHPHPPVHPPGHPPVHPPVVVHPPGHPPVVVHPPGHPPVVVHPPGHPPVVQHHPHHFPHWVLRNGVWVIVNEEIQAAPVVSSAMRVAPQAVCSCLTKTYTPDGVVVFADVCTNESASADSAAGDATQTPTSATQ